MDQFDKVTESDYKPNEKFIQSSGISFVDLPVEPETEETEQPKEKQSFIKKIKSKLWR